MLLNPLVVDLLRASTEWVELVYFALFRRREADAIDTSKPKVSQRPFDAGPVPVSG